MWIFSTWLYVNGFFFISTETTTCEFEKYSRFYWPRSEPILPLRCDFGNHYTSWVPTNQRSWEDKVSNFRYIGDTDTFQEVLMFWWLWSCFVSWRLKFDYMLKTFYSSSEILGITFPYNVCASADNDEEDGQSFFVQGRGVTTRVRSRVLLASHLWDFNAQV